MRLNEIEKMITLFDNCNITTTDKKLLNYWRKGVDLDQIGYLEESYLAFFKIVEYFFKCSTLNILDIPKKYHNDKSMVAAYKFANGTKLKKLNAITAFLKHQIQKPLCSF